RPSALDDLGEQRLLRDGRRRGRGRRRADGRGGGEPEEGERGGGVTGHGEASPGAGTEAVFAPSSRRTVKTGCAASIRGVFADVRRSTRLGEFRCGGRRRQGAQDRRPVRRRAWAACRPVGGGGRPVPRPLDAAVVAR